MWRETAASLFEADVAGLRFEVIARRAPARNIPNWTRKSKVSSERQGKVARKE